MLEERKKERKKKKIKLANVNNLGSINYSLLKKKGREEEEVNFNLIFSYINYPCLNHFHFACISIYFCKYLNIPFKIHFAQYLGIQWIFILRPIDLNCISNYCFRL